MRARARGAALMLVLWLLLLMAGLIAGFALAARTEALQGSALRQAVAGRYAAEAGVDVAVLHLLDPDPARRWQGDGRPYVFALEGMPVEVRVVDESGKLDLNLATPAQLAGLLVAVGAEPDRAAKIAAAIQDWRDEDDLLSPNGAEDPDYAAAKRDYGAKDQPFVVVSELQQVLGMDFDLYRAAAPHLTVYSGDAQPRLFSATPEVLQAIGLGPAEIERILAMRAAWQPGLPPPVMPDGSLLVGDGSGTYSISSRASRPDGAATELHAVVRAGGGGLSGQLYTPLAWRVGDPD